jgi:hypothetical protein
MQNIVRLTAEQILTLAEALTAADLRGSSVRLNIEKDGGGIPAIQWDAGAGWTAPQRGERW